MVVARSAVASRVMSSSKSSPTVLGSSSSEVAAVVVFVIVPAVVPESTEHVRSSVSDPALAILATVQAPVALMWRIQPLLGPTQVRQVLGQ